ncbi:MAG: periplasmic heavy metal sensor [Reyranella sp.]|uniref:Spy/CpxP family protein refolding chaperone n=1 Tax=Reyranella sp. TaxID=1929291 RepID=UPI002730CF5D|nr:periplasmic heavy metal sensor [Reyranella sp.]MDP1966064.1 periplasmic heavy metal sensor [Reyranella sp.]MDP2374223.1 periplasmic heavy metal sensor [Reyranella sp.]
MHYLATLFAVAVALPVSALAQHSPPQPYAGLDSRPIKALSPEQLADLRGGRGMGLALPAELNGYPGPMHVLELAGPLGLTPEQRGRTEALVADMKAEAIPLGERLIADEAALDRLFAEKRATAATLDAASASIGAAQAALRAAHLRYHLDMIAVLTPEQVAHYAMLRGYGGGTHRH